MEIAALPKLHRKTPQAAMYAIANTRPQNSNLQLYIQGQQVVSPTQAGYGTSRTIEVHSAFAATLHAALPSLA